MQIDHKTSRRDFLKKIGAIAISGSIIGTYRGSGSRAKEISLPQANLDDFKAVNKYLIGNFDDDTVEEIVMAYNSENEKSFLKLYAFGDKSHLNIIYDKKDNRQPAEGTDILYSSARQIGKDKIAFITDLFQTLKVPEEVKKVSRNSKLRFDWRIDLDKDKDTGETGVYTGAEYMLSVIGNEKKWEILLKKCDTTSQTCWSIKQIPTENLKVNGNEIEVSLDLEGIGYPSEFNYEALATGIGPFKRWPMDELPTHPRGGRANLNPGNLKIDPEFDGIDRKFAYIYELPSPVKNIERSEVDGDPIAIVDTATEKYQFKWNSEKKDFEIELQ